jgi:drug/metabolite transporter (DMT)-like permease
VEILIYAYSLALAADAAMLVAFEPSSLAALFDHSLRTWMGLLLIGTVANGLAMALWLFLLTRMDVSQASVSVYLLPFFGVLQATVFLHEQITLPMVIGGVITLAGTILTVSTENTRRTTDSP